MENKSLEKILTDFNGDLRLSIKCLYDLYLAFVEMHIEGNADVSNLTAYKDELYILRLIINYLEERERA